MGSCSLKKKKRPKPSRNARIAKRAQSRSKNAEDPPSSTKKCKNPPIFTIKKNDRIQFLATTTPTPISRWLLWHMFVTQQCFNDEIFRTRTLNKVFAPLAILTHCVTLWRLSDGTTRKFLSKFLRVEGFYGIESFDEVTLDFQRYTSKFIFHEVSDTNMVSMSNKLIISDELELLENFNKATKPPANTQVLKLTIDENNFDSVFKTVLDELRNACGSEFTVGAPEKLARLETKMLSIVGTCVRASFEAEAFKFKNSKFLSHYGIRQLDHPFFILKGYFSHAVFTGFEIWRIPLKQRKPCEKSDKTTNLSLMLVRPEVVGDICQLEHIDYFDRIAKAIQIISHREPKRSSLLLPFVDLPYNPDSHVTYGVTDLTVNWRAGFGQTVVSNFTNAGKSASTPLPPSLDRFFHCASIRMNPAGITYQGSPDSSSRETKLSELSIDNSLKLKPAKTPKNTSNSLSKSTLSRRVKKMVSENGVLPEKYSNYQKREKLQHFNGRFDSPFLFYVVDLERSGIVLSGCYAGRPAPASNQIQKSASNMQMKHAPSSVKRKTKRCSVC